VNSVGGGSSSVCPSTAVDLPRRRGAAADHRPLPPLPFAGAGVPPPPGLPPRLWAAATADTRPPSAAMLRNPASPYHTGQAIARPPKSSSLPADRGQYPLSPGSSGSGPAAAMSFFAR